MAVIVDDSLEGKYKFNDVKIFPHLYRKQKRLKAKRFVLEHSNEHENAKLSTTNNTSASES